MSDREVPGVRRAGSITSFNLQNSPGTLVILQPHEEPGRSEVSELTQLARGRASRCRAQSKPRSPGAGDAQAVCVPEPQGFRNELLSPRAMGTWRKSGGEEAACGLASGRGRPCCTGCPLTCPFPVGSLPRPSLSRNLGEENRCKEGTVAPRG